MGGAGDPATGPGGTLTSRPDAPIAETVRLCLGSDADPPPDLLARVQQAFGPDGFSILAAPSDAAGVAAVLAACTRSGWPVAPIGGATWPLATAARAGATGTGPGGGDTDHRAPVVLSTARLDRIVEHEPADLVVGVQAGTPLRRLNAELAARDQWLPLDPPTHDDATIGAVAALASAGPLRAAYGTPRDLALGVEIATGDGRLLRFGGRVVKNVAGYDGVRLAMGSAGRLGIITGLFLKVYGRPRSDDTLAVYCGSDRSDAGRAAALALDIRQAVACDALEIIGPALASALAAERAEWTVLVRLLGNAAAVAEGTRRVDALAEKHSSAVSPVARLAPDLWSSLARTEAHAKRGVQLSGKVTGLADVLQLVTGTERLLVAAHAASGIVRAWAAPDGAADALAAVTSAGRERGWASRGHRVRTPADDPGVGDAGANGRGGPAGRIEEAIRTAFDPASILLVPDWGE